MATAYWIEKSAFGNFINFTDDASGGVVTVSDQIEIEYLGTPAPLTMAGNIEENVGKLAMWKTCQTVYGILGKGAQQKLAFDNVKALRILINKYKNAHSSDMTIKQWDF